MASDYPDIGSRFPRTRGDRPYFGTITNRFPRTAGIDPPMTSFARTHGSPAHAGIDLKLPGGNETVNVRMVPPHTRG